MGHFAAGFAGAIRRWPIVILLWAAGACFALAFSLAAGQWLDLALDASLATRTLLKDLDIKVLIDLRTYHGESFALLLVVGLVIGLAQVAVGTWLNAAVAGTAQDAMASVSLREFWRCGLALYPVCLRLWALATAIEVGGVAVIGAIAWLVTRWLSESPSEMAVYYVLGAAGVLAALWLVGLVAIHDHARLYAARRGVGALRAYGWAAWFVVRGDSRAPVLALALVLAGGAWWLAYQTGARWIPTTSAFGGVMSLAWGQVLMQGRAVARVAAFVAQSELQAEMPE